MASSKIDKKCKSLDNSNNIFKEIITHCNNPKFEYLDRWQNFQAYSFKEENNTSKAKKFKFYKRGSIIFVNFGTSIGSELSGHHFSIVLSKDDNPFNAKLTVLPLTSKNKKYNLNLGKHISLKFYQKIGDELADFLGGILDMEIKMYHKAEISMSFNGNLYSGNSLTTFIKNIPNNQELINRINIDSIAKNLKIKGNVNDYVVKWLNDIIQIEEYYKEKEKDSYGIVDSITTISKYRINKPINHLDPIGKVKVSDYALKLIDFEILKRLTSLDLTSFAK